MGLSVYYLHQAENDKLEGETVPEAAAVWLRGRKGEVFAIDPSLSYKNKNKNSTMFIAQRHHEGHSANRFRGDKMQFKLVPHLLCGRRKRTKSSQHRRVRRRAIPV